MANQVPNENDHLSNCYIASLLINETKMEDETNYVLVVENREGKIEHSIRLNVCARLAAGRKFHSFGFSVVLT